VEWRTREYVLRQNTGDPTYYMVKPGKDRKTGLYSVVVSPVPNTQRVLVLHYLSEPTPINKTASAASNQTLDPRFPRRFLHALTRGAASTFGGTLLHGDAAAQFRLEYEQAVKIAKNESEPEAGETIQKMPYRGGLRGYGLTPPLSFPGTAVRW